MKKTVVAILKASSWKEYALFKKHPEYLAIFNLIERHRDLNFVLTGTSKSALSRYLIKDNVVAWDIPVPHGLIGHFTTQLHLFRIFLETRPRLIISMGLLNVVPSLIFSFFSPKSKVAPIFIGEFDYHGRKIVGRLLNFVQFKIMSIVLRLSQTKIANAFALSRWEREGIEKMAPNMKGKIRLVSYPISSLFYCTKRKLDEDKNIPILLTVAGIEPRKGLDVLVKAISLLPMDIRPRVVIKGGIRDHFYMQQLVRLVEKLSLVDWIQFDNSIIDYATLWQYYQAATLFVFPTREDCLGVVVLEALHSGLPVVATSVGGIPDMVQNGVNGILIEPNSPQELSNVISWLLKDKASRDYLARNAVSTLRNQYYDRMSLEDAFEKSVQDLQKSFVIVRLPTQ
jgi:glycosyltransferase involved in cell wall biosynthesis